MKKLFFLMFLIAGSALGQVPQSDFKSVVWYDIWSYYQYPPHRMQYNGITDLVMFGGGTAGIEPNNTSPYLPFRDYNNFAYRSIMHGDGWSSKQTFFPGSTGTWMQLIRDSCNANGINLILDLGGEWGSPATAFNDLIATPSKWEPYLVAMDEACQNNPDGVKFDGVSLDIEWLNTASAAGRQQFADFINAMKAHLNAWPKPGRLGMATAMWFLWGNNPSTPYMTSATANQFDWLFIMGYNTYNSSRLGFEAQVYQHPAINGVEVWNDRATTQYTANGVDPKRVVLGTSGEVLKQTILGTAVPGGSASGSTTGSGSGPRVNQIFETAQLDPIAKSTYAVDGNTWYSFETFASTNEKIKIAQSYGLGGIGYYSTFASNDGNNATSINKPLNAYQNAIAGVIGGFTPTPDSIAPSITLTTPVNGSTVFGTVVISANASDNIGISRVEFIINGALNATDYTSPYAYSWNASAITGARTISAKAYDFNGNYATSSLVNVIVIAPPPDTVRPMVNITSPTNGATVWGLTTIVANASDNVGVTKVDFIINGTVAATDNSSPFTYAWNTLSSSGNKSLTAKAYDAAGNMTISTVISVFVQQPPPSIANSWIYQDTLQSPWRDTSWNSANSYKSTEQVYSGSYSLKTIQSEWGAFSVRSGPVGLPADIDPTKFSELEFAIYPTTSGLVLNVYCYNDYGDVFPDIIKSSIPANQWTVISVPMNELNPDNYVIHRVNIQNYTRLNPTYYIDNVHFISPLQTPILTSPPPGGFVEDLSLVLIWDSTALATQYQLQVSTDSLFTRITVDDSSLTVTSKQIGHLMNYATYYWRVRARNSATTSGWSEIRRVLYSNPAKWKIVSLPFKVSDFRRLFVFPTALSHAFAFVGGSGYAIRDTITNGVGYWMRFGLDFTMSPPTDSLYRDTVDIEMGWNLIGSISVPVDVHSITSIPPGVTTSSFFAYSSSAYKIADSIRPGLGYWVKSTQQAKLIFATNAPSMTMGKISLDMNDEMPPPPPGDDIENVKIIPTVYGLEQNYPNPFNPSTIISYALPRAEFVSLKVYDILGREVVTLVNEQREAGIYQETFTADRLASGLYIYRLTAGSFAQIKKMMLVK